MCSTGLDAWEPKITLDLSDQELVELFKDEPFDFPTGEEFLYHNSGFYLLGMIIGEVSGEGYREYLSGHLFEPLGLDGSYYCDERPLIPWRSRVSGEPRRVLLCSPKSPKEGGIQKGLDLTFRAWDPFQSPGFIFPRVE